MNYNTTGYLGANRQRNRYSVGLGNSRSSKGSLNRPYNFCLNTTPFPLHCLMNYPLTYTHKWLNPFGEGLYGLNNSVNTITIGPLGNLLIGGSFNKAGSVNCNCIVIWLSKIKKFYNPFFNNWLGSGPVRTISLSETNSDIFIGGTTNDGNLNEEGLNGIVRWNSESPKKFFPLQGGTSSSECYCIANTPSKIVIGNGFGWVYTTIPPSLSHYLLSTGIAVWDLTTQNWEKIEPTEQGSDRNVYNFKKTKDGIYIVGNFLKFINNSEIFNGITYFTPNENPKLNPVGDGIYIDYFNNASINTIDIDPKGYIYIGGLFSQTGSQNSFNNCFNNIGKWNGTQWNPLGTGLNGVVNCITIDKKGNVYATGEFTATGDNNTLLNYIAKWDGSKWSSIQGGLNGKGYTIVLDEDENIIVGGEFTQAGDVKCKNIAIFGTITTGF